MCAARNKHERPHQMDSMGEFPGMVKWLDGCSEVADNLPGINGEMIICFGDLEKIRERCRVE